MAKFCGKIGFVETVETSPDVWEEKTTERLYYGDLIRSTRRLENQSRVNDSININNEISIIADPYIRENLFSMRYVEFMGSKWKISGVDVQFPRLILSVGGLYNE